MFTFASVIRRKIGAGGFHLETAKEAFKMGSELGKSLQEELTKKLEEDERRAEEEEEGGAGERGSFLNW